ncbi:MAG: class I SAM-dependent methyltransferase [Proteobacteria bacterium]|nr:class I SAM-dependent methyltransferase [Pseudomonadota bacterium]
MTPAGAPDPNASQAEYWNAAAGETWARFQALLDRQIEPLGEEALRELAPVPGERVLDVGCGCGQTTWEIAARVGPDGAVLGVDLSAPMLAVARGRPRPVQAAAAEFRQADAQVTDLGHDRFDAVYSRFGVMFFADRVAAFANLRAMLRPGGRLAFVCWRELRENPWMQAPLDAARPHLPPLPPSDPDAPGPYSLADAARVRSTLAAAGFEDVVVRRHDARIGAGGVDEALTLALRVGPLGAALREHPDLKDSVAAPVRDVLEQHADAGGVRMAASVWIVRARRAPAG